MVSYTDMLTILLILFIAITAKGVQAPEPPRQAMPDPPRQRLLDPAPLPTPRCTESPLGRGSREIGARRNCGAPGDPRPGYQPSARDSVRLGRGPCEPRRTADGAEIADAIRNLPNKISLVGHADSRPIRNSRFRNNWELSSARSLRLLEALNQDCGIPESRMSVESVGSYDPQASDETEQGRASNRRVEIVVLNWNY